MDSSTALEIMLIVQALVVGGLIVYAYQHWNTHLRTNKATPAPPQTAAKVVLPPDFQERLLRASQTDFETALKASSKKLEQDLGITSGHVNNLVLRLATEIVSGELERYRQELVRLHQEAASAMQGIRGQVAQHEAEIEAKAKAEFEAEKQRLIKQIDTKLADAVGSFLTETLGHGVDLGSQTAYLVSLLEEHKADFLKEVGDGLKPAK